MGAWPTSRQDVGHRDSCFRNSESAGCLPFHWALHSTHSAGGLRAPRIPWTQGDSSKAPGLVPGACEACQSSCGNARCRSRCGCCDRASPTVGATRCNAWLLSAEVPLILLLPEISAQLWGRLQRKCTKMPRHAADWARHAKLGPSSAESTQSVPPAPGTAVRSCEAV